MLPVLHLNSKTFHTKYVKIGPRFKLLKAIITLLVKHEVHTLDFTWEYAHECPHRHPLFLSLFLTLFPLLPAQVTVLIRAHRGIHFSALPWQSNEEGVFSLTGAVTLINDPLIAACLPGNTVHTLCLPNTHTLTHTPLISPPVASCPADTHTQITLHANWATSPLTNSCLMSWSSPLQGRACLSPQDGSPELWEEESTVKRSHWVCLHTRSYVIECGSYSL